MYTFPKLTEEVKDFSNAKLQQQRANVYKTKAQSRGRKKTERNEAILEIYDAEISSRGLEVANLKGVFNGPGAS